MKKHTLSAAEASALRERNNPGNAPTGHFTGRCSRCGSNDLWDDNLAYGCNRCGAILSFGDIEPRLVPDQGY